MKKISINIKFSVLFLFLFVITYFVDFFTVKTIPVADLLLCTFADAIFMIFLRKLDSIYYLGILFFTVLAQYFGGMLKLYELIPYYDVFLHFMSGALLVLLADYLYSLLMKRFPNANVPNTIRHLLVFFAAVSCAAFWEIWEFSGDTLLHLQAQGGLLDTMRDIIAGTLGAIIGVLILIFVLSKKKK